MKKTLASALAAKGYTTLTPVQEAVTEPGREGADLLVSAQTGSGKTVGFGLAIAPKLLGEEDRFGPAAAPLALVIAPTRELALQVTRELSWLYAEAGAVMASCVGGMDARNERRALDRGAHILVATPGRLCDHLRRGNVDLSSLRAVVLDEADEMLDLGFREDLETILQASAPDRQTLMFSATVSPEIARLAERYQREAQRVSVQGSSRQHSDIDYRAVLVAERDEENAITNLLRFHEAPNAIVFANTRATVSRLVTRLSNRGFAVVGLSGELSQAERSHALQAMRDGRARVCVATDVAARGIDLPNLDLVIHAELPLSEEALLHRSGRTGRAGRKGISALIVSPRARKKAERMLRFAKLTCEWESAPSADAVLARDEARLLADPIWTEPATEADLASVQQMVEAHGPEELALAMLRLWRGQRSAPEELMPVNAAPVAASAAPAPFGASRWFTISVGYQGNANPRWLLPKMCQAGDITRDEVGAIRITDELTYVEIADSAADGFMDTLGPDLQIAPGLVMEPVDGLPDDLRGAARKPRPGGPGGFRSGGPSAPGAQRKGPGAKPRRTLEAEGASPRRAPEGDAPAKPRRSFEDAAVHSRPKPKGPRVDGMAKPGTKPAGKPAGAGKPKGKFAPKGAGKPAPKPHRKG